MHRPPIEPVELHDAASEPLTHFWRVRTTLPDRTGQRCRVVARGAGPGPRNILVEFADGYRVVTHRYAVRRLLTV